MTPTLKLGHDNTSELTSSQDSARHNRLVVRRERNWAALTNMVNPTLHNNWSHVEVSTQTELSDNNITALQEELQWLIDENKILKDKVASCTIGEDLFQDDETMKDFTGLPDVAAMIVLFNFLQDHVPYTSASALSKFQQLILVLVHLRQNSSHVDLCQTFGIKKSTSSKNVFNMLQILYIQLRPLTSWPNREQLKETMPMCFRAHLQEWVAVIVDCFEVHIDQPSNLAARAQTWSSYKHHNTAKFLIGISPQGMISYISQGWDGRSSDQHVMEQCGILNYLLPGDEVWMQTSNPVLWTKLWLFAVHSQICVPLLFHFD